MTEEKPKRRRRRRRPRGKRPEGQPQKPSTQKSANQESANQKSTSQKSASQKHAKPGAGKPADRQEGGRPKRRRRPRKKRPQGNQQQPQQQRSKRRSPATQSRASQPQDRQAQDRQARDRPLQPQDQRPEPAPEAPFVFTPPEPIQRMRAMEEALAESPADETEIVWLQTRRGRASSRKGDGELSEYPEITVFVRVLERGRLGTHRGGAADDSELRSFIRQAIAQSRTRDTLQGLPHLPAPEAQGDGPEDLLDPEITSLDPSDASKRLHQNLRKGEHAELDWGHTELLIANSRGLRRRTEVTDCSLRVRCSTEAGGGRAASSSRSLAGLDMKSVVERARQRTGSGEIGEIPSEKTAVLLAPEAMIPLLGLLNETAFTASAYQEGSSFLREHLGVQVFDRRLNLCDDATDPSGLPFPFDFEGTNKGPIDLIVKGAPQTPALDQRQAAALGLQPTGHAVAGNDAIAQHLFMRAGEDTHDELLARCSEGVFIGWIDRVECFDAPRVRFRATARGVRRIEGGELGGPLPDLIWEDSLLHALSHLSGLGSQVVTWSLGGSSGALSAPALALDDVVGLQPERQRPAPSGN